MGCMSAVSQQRMMLRYQQPVPAQNYQYLPIVSPTYQPFEAQPVQPIQATQPTYQVTRTYALRPILQPA